MAKRPSTANDTEAMRTKAEEIVSTYGQKNSKALSIEETSGLLHELQVHQIELEMQNDELRKIQSELDEERERYFDLYNLAPVGYCTLTEEGVILESNLTAATLLGVSQSALIGKPISSYIHNDDQDSYYLYRKKVLQSGESRSCELRMVRTNLAPCWVALVSRIDQSNDGKRSVKVLISDISERKKIEKELKDTEQMLITQSRQATMGEMVEIIAHQWRQPLNIVSLAIADIETNYSFKTLNQSEFNDKIAIVTENIVYMSETIDDFRDYFNPNLINESTTMEKVLRDTQKIIGGRLERHKIALSIEGNVKRNISIHKNQLIQVLLNIIGNAVDAIVSNKTPLPSINISMEKKQDTLTISICDNAGGIPVAIIDKINEPYFTTKELNGTGLGLYLSQTIIKKYFSGSIMWYNKGHGACFVITLKAVYEE